MNCNYMTIIMIWLMPNEFVRQNFEDTSNSLHVSHSNCFHEIFQVIYIYFIYIYIILLFLFSLGMK